jgi:hypothetical protein
MSIYFFSSIDIASSQDRSVKVLHSVPHAWRESSDTDDSHEILPVFSGIASTEEGI